MTILLVFKKIWGKYMKKIKKYLAMGLILAMAFTGSLVAESSAVSGDVADSLAISEDSEDLVIGTASSDDFSADGESDVSFLVTEYTINNNDSDGFTLTIDSLHNGYLLKASAASAFVADSATDPGHSSSAVEIGDKIDYKIKVLSDTATPFDETSNEHWGLSTQTLFSTYVGLNNDAVSGTNLGLAAGCDVPDDGEIVISFAASAVDMSTDDASMELYMVIPQENNLFNGDFSDTITVTLANL